MGSVTVKSTKNGYKQEIKSEKHSFACDIPVDLGGTDTAPDPHELLFGSLGSCTAITVQMYAKKKNIPLEGVLVKLWEEKIADPENESRTMPKINRELTVEGNLTNEQIEDLKAAANKCPIHKLISGKNVIETSIKAAATKS